MNSYLFSVPYFEYKGGARYQGLAFLRYNKLNLCLTPYKNYVMYTYSALWIKLCKSTFDEA